MLVEDDIRQAWEKGRNAGRSTVHYRRKQDREDAWQQRAKQEMLADAEQRQAEDRLFYTAVVIMLIVAVVVVWLWLKWYGVV